MKRYKLADINGPYLVRARGTHLPGEEIVVLKPLYIHSAVYDTEAKGTTAKAAGAVLKSKIRLVLRIDQ